MSSAPGTRTTCAYCGVGCGVLATSAANGEIHVSGDTAHPANRGRLCAKGAALGETLGERGRLLHPRVRGARSDWPTAINAVANAFNAAITEHGPESVAFYVSGQLLTEDYYVANKLMKGFIGAANIDTNSRLCMASSVAGHKRAFGEDVVPGVYEDLEQADLVVLVGSNLAWCHPVLHQRLIAAREERALTIVVIDPRETATTADCDLHLPIAPGGDVALFHGLLRELARRDAIDHDFVSRHTRDFTTALGGVEPFTVEHVATATGLSVAAIESFYTLFAAHERCVTVYSQGVNQSSAGTDKVNAIINCHLATGRIGKAGCGPFSVTGQPNAMGGRETGGLANMLAAHIDFDDPVGHAAVADFWNSATLATQPGLKAVDLFDAVHDGRIKALWIMATNPAVSMPEQTRIRAALEACPFVAVSDVATRADTAEFADVLLPAAAWGEKDGTVTNSERMISRQRAFLSEPGAARPDWWIITRVAQAMGHAEAFDYHAPHEIFAEYARATALPSERPRVLDISALGTISRAQYDALEPFRWPLKRHPGDRDALRLFADGGFSTDDGRARFVAAPWRAPASQPDADHPLVLTSGRIRDQWHTMTRTGDVARLNEHLAEPFVELNPQDADVRGIGPADIVEISNATGRARMRALITRRVSPGVVFAPMHWSRQHAGSAFVNELFSGAVDPVSGQPELKHACVTLERMPATWFGFAVTRNRPGDPELDYWVRAATRGGWRMELASTDHAGLGDAALEELFARLCGPAPAGAEQIRMADRAAQHYRFAAFHRDRLLAVLFVSARPVHASRGWVAARLTDAFDHAAKQRLLAGAPDQRAGDPGATVCSCHGVGTRQILAAIDDGCGSVAAVGEMTAAGTGCGSCRPEIKALIVDQAVKDSA